MGMGWGENSSFAYKMSHLEPALLNVKLCELGAVLEGAKLFQCLVSDWVCLNVTILPGVNSILCCTK